MASFPAQAQEPDPDQLVSEAASLLPTIGGAQDASCSAHCKDGKTCQAEGDVCKCTCDVWHDAICECYDYQQYLEFADDLEEQVPVGPGGPQLVGGPTP